MENIKQIDSNETEIDGLITYNRVKEEISLSLDSSLTYRTSSVQSLSDTNNSDLEVVWHNLRYVVQKKSLKNSKLQTFELIRNASGKGLGGKVTALLGPSGCGKTTLLQCIAGLRTVGLTGDIYVTSGPKTRIAFCPQKDHHLGQLTVWETLMFASKLKNYNNIKNENEKWDPKAHNRVVDNVLKQLGLDSCAKVRVSSCSGGQQKRLSIGVELVNRPNILFLDEPTSGLDSTSCLQCIKLLQHLSRGSPTMHPMVIIASIHQPSAQVLNRIDYLYIMSNGGRPIYFGPTNQLNNTLSSYNLSCPIYETPTDFVMCIASGDHGINIIERMAFNQIERSGYFHDVPDDSTSISKIVQKSKRRSHPFFLHVWQLFKRSNLCIWRQPQLTALRLFTSILIALMISFIYVNPIGQSSGCMESFIFEFDLMRPMGDCLSNLGFVFFSLLFIAMSAMMPTILTFPLEINVLLKERANGWYSCSTYYIAKSIADIPYQIAFPLIYCSISYFATSQILELWRMTVFFVVNIILAFISQTIGLLIGAIFAEDFTSAVYGAALVTAPLLLFTGFLVPFREMPEYLHPFTYISWFRYAMEAIVISMYGFDRCQSTNMTLSSVGADALSLPTLPKMNKILQLAQYLTENDLLADAVWFLNKDVIDYLKSGGSLVLKFFVLNDNQLYPNLGALVVFMIIIRFIGYYSLLLRINSNK